MTTELRGWSTAQEVDFVRRLGQHSELGIAPIELLRQYRGALLGRAAWDNIDPRRVLVAVRERILSLTEAQRLRQRGNGHVPIRAEANYVADVLDRQAGELERAAKAVNASHQSTTEGSRS